MDDVALKLVKAQHLLATEQRERVRLQHELKMVRLELSRARRMVVSLQRERGRNADAGTAARSETRSRA